MRLRHNKRLGSKGFLALGGTIIDRLETLAAFVAIADHGSFAAAARALRVSPPAMTRAIAGLEARLGVQLLQRTTRSLALTPEGAAFLERTRRILADLRDAELGAMGAAAEPGGPLVLTASQMLGRLHLVPIVAALLQRYPKLDVRLLLIDRPIALVEEGIDVAVRIGALADSALHAVKVGEVRRTLVAAPDYLARHGTPAAPAELRRHAVIAFTGLDPTDDWRFGAGARTVVRLRPRLVVNTADVALAAAEAGAGIARLLSYQVADALTAGRLVRLLPDAEPPPAPVHLLFGAGRGAAPAVRMFLEAARAHFAQAF